MKLLISSCLSLIYLLVQAPPALGGNAARDVHVWRGEYEHALSSPGGELDEAAYLTLAGLSDSALAALGATTDSLRYGLLAFRAGRFDEAALWLDCTLDNSYLESLRLMNRALALQAESRHAEAVAEFEKLVRFDADSMEITVGQRARDLLVEAAFRSGSGSESLLQFTGGIDDLSGRSALFMSAILLDEGRETEAMRAFMRGIGSASDSASVAVTDTLIDRFMDRLDAIDDEGIIALAEEAISSGKVAEASALIEHLASARSSNSRSELLKGALLRSEGRHESALSVYQKLFRSEAPVAAKKEALLEIASVEYHLGRYTRSASSYRMFGLYYPDDRRSAYALDVAARIFVARERFDDGLRTWERLRERGFGSTIAREAALSESVLLFVRGDSRRAREILSGLLATGDEGLEAAVMYWLYRTAAADGDAAAWKRRLIEKHPYSFYSAAARGEDSFSVPGGTGENRGEALPIERLESREREFVESVSMTLRPDEVLFDHPAYRALTYYLGRGFVDEARICVSELARLFGSDTARMAALYATVRSSGLVDVGLKLLWTKGLSGEGSPEHHALRYPVAFSSFVAREAERNNLPVELLFAIIREESSFDRFAVSRAGALGLMQLMPRTGAWIGGRIEGKSYGTDELLDPDLNIAAGSWYIRYLLDRCGGSVVAALAAYNGGETRLSGWRKMFRPSEQPVAALELIGPRETRRYVRKVLDTMAAYQAIALYEPEL